MTDFARLYPAPRQVEVLSVSPPAAVPPRARLGAAAALLRRGAAHFNASRPAAAATAFRGALGLLSPWRPLGPDSDPLPPAAESASGGCDTGPSTITAPLGETQAVFCRESCGNDTSWLMRETGRADSAGSDGGGKGGDSVVAGAGASGVAAAALRARGRRAAARGLGNLAAALLRLGVPAEALEACDEVLHLLCAYDVHMLRPYALPIPSSASCARTRLFVWSAGGSAGALSLSLSV
jgi:hypothetical protein